jgi:hypothetical protein
MNVIYFDPSIHIWKDIILNNIKPCICRYGKENCNDKELAGLALICDFDLVVFPNFNEDDIDLEYDPIYIIFYKGKLINSVSYYDFEKIEKLEKILLNIGAGEDSIYKSNLPTEILNVEKTYSSNNNRNSFKK